MTKKILALALAGTTAFSVFASAMSVNATAPEGAFGTAYDAPTLAINSGELTIGGSKISGAADVDAVKALVAKLVLIEEYSEVDDVEIETGKIYLLDYELDGDTEGTSNSADFAALQEVLDNVAALDAYGTAPYDTAANIANKVYTAVKNYLKDDDTNFTLYQNQGDSGSFRRTVYDAFDDLSPASDSNFDPTDVTDYNYGPESTSTTLLGAIAAVDPLTATTSEMMHLIQAYNTVTGLMTPADTSSTEDLIARYISILDARDSADYKNAYDFTSFSAAYEKILADYESASTNSKLLEYKGKLSDLIFTRKTGTTAGADKTELNAAIDTAESLRAADYDTGSDAWLYKNEILGEAKKIKALNKNYSYQSTIDAYTALLTEAIDTLDPSTSVSNWLMLRLESLIEDADGRVESDYTTVSWKKLAAPLATARKLMESSNPGKTSVTNACDTLEAALTALVEKKPSATLKKQLQNTIADAEDALNALDSTSSGYQVAALTKAISEAGDLFTNKNRTDLKPKTTVSSIEAAIAALEAAMTSAAQPQGWYTTTDGKYMYGEGDGYYVDGWKKIGNFWFFFNEDGTAKQNEWFQDGGNWYYCGNSCVAYSGWGMVDGSWYYFSKSNVMCTGWVRPANSYYYLDPTSGKMVTGWAQIGGKWYYFSTDANTLGAMLVSTTTPDGYQVGADGAMI